MNIGEALRKTRLEKKITQRKLASLSGISTSYLSDIENNARRPSIELIQTISSALQVNFVYVLLKALEKDDLKNESKALFLKEINDVLDEAFL